MEQKNNNKKLKKSAVPPLETQTPINSKIICFDSAWLVVLGKYKKDLSKPLEYEQVAALPLTEQESVFIKDWLWSFVKRSKEDASASAIVNAAMAITTLNAMGVSFIGKCGDLAGVKIRGANLQGALLSHAQFKGADLRRVNFTRAYMKDANFTGANLEGARFGELPSLMGITRVNCVAYSRDGKYMAVGYNNGEIAICQKKIANATSPNSNTLYEPDCVLQTNILSVCSVSFSPDGSTLAFAGLKNTNVYLWDVESGKQRAILEGHKDVVMSVSFSPSGDTLASGSHDNTVRLWDVQNGKAKAVCTGHTDYVTSVSFSPYRLSFASGSCDKTVRLWDVQSGKAKAVLTGHTDGVTSISFSPNAYILASGSCDKTVRLWDVTSGKAKAVFPGHVDMISSVVLRNKYESLNWV